MNTVDITSHRMLSETSWRRQLPSWLTVAACTLVPVSIAVSQIFIVAAALALAIRAADATRMPLKDRGSEWLPAGWLWPLLGFMVCTTASLAFSAAPAAGVSQIRKLLLLGVIALAYSAFRNPSHIEWTLRLTLLTGSASAAWGLMQFVADYRYIAEQGLPFYENYITHQITGFMSHWMTYGGQLMLIVVGLASAILFGRGRERALGTLGLMLAATALLAAFTRGAWLGALTGITFLAYTYRKWLAPVIPLAVLILSLIAPDALRKREESIVEPASDSSIQSRLVMARAGLNMIAAHPMLGVGPERIAPEFDNYRPRETTLPPAWYGHLHNSYLQFAAERGLPALFFVLWMLLEMLRTNMALLRGDDPALSRRLARIGIAATLAMGVLGLFEYNFGDSEVLMLFLFLVTLPSAARRLEQAKESRV